MSETPSTSSAGSLDGLEPRLARSEDLAGVVAMWVALTRHHAHFDPLYAMRSGARAEVRGLVAAQLRDPRTAIFVVGETGRLVGFASVRVAQAPPIHPESVRAEITDLFVEPGARRRGVGSALVRAATRWARERGASRIEVRVAVANREGQAFWRAQNYADHMDVLHRRL